MSYFNQSGDGMDEVQAVFTRSEIFELMGECAIPPFAGHPEADSWNISDMIQPIIAAVDRAFSKKLPGTKAPGQRVETNLLGRPSAAGPMPNVDRCGQPDPGGADA